MATTPRIQPAPGGHRTDLFGHVPELGLRFRSLYGTLWREGVLDQPTKEAARLRNARITDCGF